MARASRKRQVAIKVGSCRCMGSSPRGRKPVGKGGAFIDHMKGHRRGDLWRDHVVRHFPIYLTLL
jgi:hypothetical protein